MPNRNWMTTLNAKLRGDSDYERQVRDAALNAKLKRMKAWNVKLCRDSDFECQVGDAALNAKLKRMKALKAKIEN